MKVTVTLPDHLVVDLKEQSENLKMTPSLIVQRGLEKELFLLSDPARRNADILLKKQDGSIVEMLENR